MTDLKVGRIVNLGKDKPAPLDLNDLGHIIEADLEAGYAHYSPCNHAKRLAKGETVAAHDPCPVCRENEEHYQKGWNDKAKQVLIDIEKVFKK